jgi:hypothetical protein
MARSAINCMISLTIMPLSSHGREPVPRRQRRIGMKRWATALCALLLAGCAGQGACPTIRLNDGLTVDAGVFVAAHPQAGRLCVTRAPCLALHTGHPEPAVVVLPAETPGDRHVSITVTARDGTELLRTGTQVTVRHVVLNSRCGIAANEGSVSVAADGSLKLG